MHSSSQLSDYLTCAVALSSVFAAVRTLSQTIIKQEKKGFETNFCFRERFCERPFMLVNDAMNDRSLFFPWTWTERRSFFCPWTWTERRSFFSWTCNALLLCDIWLFDAIHNKNLLQQLSFFSHWAQTYEKLHLFEVVASTCSLPLLLICDGY